MNQHRSYQFAYHDWGLYLSKLVGLSDCFLSLIIGSAHSLLSFTVRSSTTIVTSWEDNLEQAWSLGQLLSDSYSLLQREISLPLLIYGLIRSTHYMDQSGLLIIFYRDFEYSLLVFTITCLLLGKIYTAFNCRTDGLIPVQYIACFNVSSSLVWPGCCK